MQKIATYQSKIADLFQDAMRGRSITSLTKPELRALNPFLEIETKRKTISVKPRSVDTYFEESRLKEFKQILIDLGLTSHNRD